MKQSVLKGLSVLSLGVFLVGCQDANQSKENDKENKTETTSKAVEEKKQHKNISMNRVIPMVDMK
ncbi:hypothetical protein [Macrococcus animalis]|uniref:hypothetical protein n=1 Tax=Macrococcus animalis TaxID=3395467 RepID=UPI0039BEA559